MMLQMSKRITTLLLALVLCLVPVTASAAPDFEKSEGRITGIRDGDVLEYAPVEIIRKSGTGGVYDDLNSLEVGPGDEIRIYLSADMFTWDDANEGNADSDGLSVSTAQLRTAKIDVRKGKSKGADVIETIEIANDNGAAYIKIEFSEYFVSVTEKDVDLNIYLAQKGKKADDTELSIAGTIENRVVEVGETDGSIDTSDGTVVEATDYIKNIEINTGNGLFIKTQMFKNKKYYAKAIQDPDSDDQTIINRYPEINTVYNLYTININAASDTVSFETDGTYYVYGSDGSYLGMSNEEVALSSKYYLADAPVDITGGDADSDD